MKFRTMWSRKKRYQNRDLSVQAKMASLTSWIGKKEVVAGGDCFSKGDLRQVTLRKGEYLS